ncbi:hypothetical protein [Streptomyces sp.]
MREPRRPQPDPDPDEQPDEQPDEPEGRPERQQPGPPRDRQIKKPGRNR